MGSRLTLSADEEHSQGEHPLNSNSQSNISYSNFEPTTSANISCTDPNCNHNEDVDEDGGGLADSSDEFQNVDESKETLNSSECLLNDMTSTSTINQQDESSIDENDDRPHDCDSAPPEYSSENNENENSTTLSNEEDESENDCTYSTYSEQYTLPDQQGFISNKSTKKMYKAVAKEWGITCKMSDQCRCLDCQSNYFGCDYDYVSWFFVCVCISVCVFTNLESCQKLRKILSVEIGAL